MSTQRRDGADPAIIFIVEDSPTQALQLEHSLAQQGYQVSIATNGKTALDLIRRRKPTIVISDVLMPEMDGYQLCRQLKADTSLRDMPVILLTTLSDPHDVIRGLECGADSFIIKPYDERHLLARVQYFLANRELDQSDQVRMGVEIVFAGQLHFITSDRLQILNLLLSVYESAIQKNQELLKTQEALRELNEDLEARVAERTAALTAEIAERQQAEEEVRRLNEGLEQRVRDRTAELQAANQELEAFSYSVSHDLRAPLRAINGLSGLLLQAYLDQLPPEGQHYLQRVRQNTQRMGQLIDDLLAFSRLGRQPVKKQPVELGALARQVLEDLRGEYEGRRVEIVLGALPACVGDPALLTQVLTNLFSNALKFTRRQAAARVEVGCQQRNGETVYFVKDNGTGFDMRYVHKLFGVFQRLHRAEDYEGTGVGLAIVQRILQRHGGRVWVEAAVNKGATFFFTVPETIVDGGGAH